MMKERRYLQITEDVMEEYDPDPDHAIQVTRLAVQLFDQIRDFADVFDADDSAEIYPQRLDPRDVLQMAAMLHDIGWSAPGTRGHHKNSRDMIMATDFGDLHDDDRSIVAQIARYHRKQHPDPTIHHDFGALDPDDQNRVRWLASILRIADGLDRNHQAEAESLECLIDEDTVRIGVHCRSADRSSVVYGGNLKKALLEEVSGLDVEIYPICDRNSRNNGRMESRSETFPFEGVRENRRGNGDRRGLGQTDRNTRSED